MLIWRPLWASGWGVKDRLDETMDELMGLMCYIEHKIKKIRKALFGTRVFPPFFFFFP